MIVWRFAGDWAWSEATSSGIAIDFHSTFLSLLLMSTASKLFSTAVFLSQVVQSLFFFFFSFRAPSLRTPTRASSRSPCYSGASACLWACGSADAEWCSQTCLLIRCAVSGNVCTCSRSPLWSCRSWCCHPGTAAECVQCGSCHWRSASPGCPADSSAFCHIPLSSWEAPG